MNQRADSASGWGDLIPPMEVGASSGVYLSAMVPVLGHTAESLRISLDVHTHGGTQAATVDLSAVTDLCSAGVRVLQHARLTAEDQGAELTLVAAPESPAHHLLTLISMPHRTELPSRQT